MKNIDDYKQRLRIDRENLEGELVEHAQILFEIADEATDAVSRRDFLKIELDELYASIDKTLRAKAFHKGEKTTEGKLANEITCSKDYKELNERFLKAKQVADRWTALSRAFYSRGEMLQSLVSIELRQLSIQNTAATHDRGMSAIKNKRGDDAVARQRKRYDEE